MQQKLSFRLGLATLLLLCALPLAAESTPEAREWLDKLQGMFSQGALTLEFDGKLSAPSIGEGTLVGKITYADATHIRALIEFELSPSGGSDEEATKMRLLTVQDGTTKWDEIDMLGAQQVTRTAIGKGAKDPGLDPVSQLQRVADTLDFKVQAVGGGRVELTAPMDESSRSSLGQLGAIPGVDGFVLVLDQETGYPLEFRATGDPPAISIRFKNLKPVDRKDLPVDSFSYEPPEGAQVLDLSGQTP
jgi:hypothetical protein